MSNFTVMAALRVMQTSIEKLQQTCEEIKTQRPSQMVFVMQPPTDQSESDSDTSGTEVSAPNE